MNAIYLHPTEGFTFLENVPEKPHCLDDAIDWKKYERALAEAIEKRMVIGNPEVIEELWKNNVRDLKEGELYPWAGTWEKKDHCGTCQMVRTQCLNQETPLDCALLKEVVILSPPKEEKPPQYTVLGQGYHIKKRMNVGIAAHIGPMAQSDKPVNSSMSYSEKKPLDELLDVCYKLINSFNGTAKEEPVSFYLRLVEAVEKFDNSSGEPVVSQDQEELFSESEVFTMLTKFAILYSRSPQKDITNDASEYIQDYKLIHHKKA